MAAEIERSCGEQDQDWGEIEDTMKFLHGTPIPVAIREVCRSARTVRLVRHLRRWISAAPKTRSARPKVVRYNGKTKGNVANREIGAPR